MLADEPAARFRAVAATFDDRVRNTTDWSAPTPVPEWEARDIVTHLVDWGRGFLAAGGISLPPVAGDEPAPRWKSHAAAVQELLDGPEAARDFTHPQAGTFVLAAAIDQFYTSDVFMHTWDLARATGQDDALDPDESARLLAGMEPVDQVLRSSGHYGPRVDVAEDAPAVDRLMAFVGRDPAWSRP